MTRPVAVAAAGAGLWWTSFATVTGNGAVRVEGLEHLWIWHSPGGFEWGYAGSGPADLALNILLAATRDHGFAAAQHQDFKRAMVEALPRQGGTIRAAAVRAWISARRAARVAVH